MRRRDPVLTPLMADLEVGLSLNAGEPAAPAAPATPLYYEVAKPLKGFVSSTHDTKIYWEVHGLSEGER